MDYREFVGGVKSYERDSWFGDHVYLDTLRETKKAKLSGRITGEFADQVLKMYLIQWGQMARTVNRKKNAIDWGAFALRIQQAVEMTSNLADVSFINVDFNDATIKKMVLDSYQALVVSNVGPTAISKILHLIRPRFFVMWDDKIRDDVGSSKSFTGSKYGYLDYLGWAQAEVKEFLTAKGIKRDNEVGPKLAKELGLDKKITDELARKTLAKLTDEYMWWKANRRP
jgi:hypothetical protein